jgi:lipopolysaccharide transport system permease protein
LTGVIHQFKKFFRYRDLFRDLVIRDIKLKYRRSVLGYLWSILNPLMTMAIMAIVFSAMFSRGIENFPVYLIIGNVLFSFMLNSSNRALGSVLANAPLLKKIYVPKYIFTFSAVSSELVNLIFSLGALLIVILVTRVHLYIDIILIIVPILELYIFCIGAGLLLASAMVFFRDTQYIWTVFCTAWMYLTPIFYPIGFLPEWLRRIVVGFNPMYFYVSVFREFVLHSGEIYAPHYMLRGAVTSVLALLIGLGVFSRTQNKFILYI